MVNVDTRLGEVSNKPRCRVSAIDGNTDRLVYLAHFDDGVEKKIDKKRCAQGEEERRKQRPFISYAIAKFFFSNDAHNAHIDASSRLRNASSS